MMRYRREDPVETWEGHEREAYVEIRSTFLQSAIIAQMEYVNSRKQVGYRLHRKI